MQTTHTPGTIVIDADCPVIATGRFDQFGNQILENTGLREGWSDCIIWRGSLYGAEMAERLRDDAIREAAPELLAALQLAQDHLAQYRRYSAEMSKIGRGLYLSCQFGEEYADTIINAALARATGAA